MSNFSFNFAEGESVIASIAEITNRIDADLTALETSVEAKLSEWTGSAREEYHAAKQRWDASAKQMAAQLSAARSSLGGIADTYSQTDLSNRNQFNSLG